MTFDDLRALADKFFEWPEGSGRQTVTTFSALLFAQHVLQLREKSLGTENSAGMDALREAAQRQLDAFGGYRREIGLLTGVPDEQPCDAEVAARAALEREQRGGGNLPPPLQVPPEVAGTLTTSDIAWLETRRLTKLWQELGQMRWDGSNESWNHAIEAVRSRINDECQAVLDWKAMADQSNVTAMELLQKMQGVRHE